MNEQEIERKAVEEILFEASTSKQRARESGVVGWTRPRYVTNKRFLFNTVASAVGARRLKSKKQEESVKQDEDTLTNFSSECCSTKCQKPDPMVINKFDVESAKCSEHMSDPPLRRASKRSYDLIDSRRYDLTTADNPSSRRETVKLDDSVYDVYDYINLNKTSSRPHCHSP